MNTIYIIYVENKLKGKITVLGTAHKDLKSAIKAMRISITRTYTRILKNFDISEENIQVIEFSTLAVINLVDRSAHIPHCSILYKFCIEELPIT